MIKPRRSLAVLYAGEVCEGKLCCSKVFKCALRVSIAALHPSDSRFHYGKLAHFMRIRSGIYGI